MTLARAFLSYIQLPVHYDTGTELLTSFRQLSVTHLSDHVQEWWKRKSLYQAPTFEDHVYMDYFLRSLFPTIRKDVTSYVPQTEEVALQISLKYDMIYAQLGYFYTILPDLPRLSGANALGASHSIDSVVGALSHPYAQPPMGYGFPQGGASTSNTFPPLDSMYPGYGMPPPFAQPSVYHNVTQPPYYPYPQPGAPTPLALAPLPPLPSQSPQQQPPPPQG